MINFQGAKITSDVVFRLVREIDERFRIGDPNGRLPERLDVARSYETFFGLYGLSKSLTDRRRQLNYRIISVPKAKNNF